MNKKKWEDKLEGLKKLRIAAKFNEKKAVDDQEELELLMSAMENKIKELS